jgi:hypothetical protein
MRTGIAGAAVSTLLGLAPMVNATTTPNPLRCHALELMCESHYEDGMARCDRVAQRRAGHSPDDAAAWLQDCDTSCDTRHTACLDRIHSRPVCSVPPTDPSPHECAAEQLQVGANFMLCEYRCSRRAGAAVAQCNTDCETRAVTDLDAIRTGPLCKDGPIVSIPGLDGNQ